MVSSWITLPLFVTIRFGGSVEWALQSPRRFAFGVPGARRQRGVLDLVGGTGRQSALASASKADAIQDARPAA